ncbi:MAG: hypothetical protein IBJ13_07345 [Sphingopyxis sp.]|nr:hypothetical protein [Sphingopyxis sp.]
MPFNLADLLNLVTGADGAAPENRRERVGCIMGLMIVVPVAVILLLVSLI